eukprot:m.226360 g.226360  ORF g.226360 m.226360 type:complete len:159 (+) comp90632_c0_seq1:62-538(+)
MTFTKRLRTLVRISKNLLTYKPTPPPPVKMVNGLEEICTTWLIHNNSVARPFVSDESTANERLRVKYFKKPAATPDGLAELRGKAYFGHACEGPPGLAHGGSQAAVLDEAMGTVVWVNGGRVLAFFNFLCRSASIAHCRSTRTATWRPPSPLRMAARS